MMNRVTHCLSLVPAFCLTVASTHAATLNVPGDFATIQGCIDAAVSGVDEGVVTPGTFRESINFDGKGEDADGKGEDAVPKGLTDSEWTSIRAVYEARRHDAFAVEGGYQVRNPGQRWRTRFDGRGFLTTPDAGGWSWGLQLLSYGRQGAEQTVTAPSRIEADEGRVSYPWDDTLTEWYVNDRRGLEHGYTIRSSRSGFARRNVTPPIDVGQSPTYLLTGAVPMPPLQLTLAVRGGLHPRISAGGRGVTFINDSGAAVVNYHGLSVLDAGGVPLPGWFEASAGDQGDALVLRIDDRGARYPLKAR